MLLCSCRLFETAVLPQRGAEFEKNPRDRKERQRQKAKHTSGPMDAQLLIHWRCEQREYRSENVSNRSIYSDSYFRVSPELYDYNKKKKAYQTQQHQPRMTQEDTILRTAFEKTSKKPLASKREIEYSQKQ
jgi:hypothetical protein